MRVIIVGLGNVGRELAELLIREGGHQLVLIDEDSELCERLATKYDALVLQGDGTEPEVLRQAGAGEADALVATTDSDALNTVIAMLGKQFGVPQIIVKLIDLGLRPACQEIGVDAIVSPNLSVANEILAIIHGYRWLDFSLIVRGGAKLAEFAPGEAKGKRLADLPLPRGSLVVSIIREDRAIVPHGEVKLKEGDLLVVVAEGERTMEKVRDILKGEES
ncbi:MAG: potassium channel family protein, partial [Candidatus Bipolaricaulia bacterium]